MNVFYLVLRIVDVLLYCGCISGLIMHWRVLFRVEPEMPQFRWGIVSLVTAGAYGVAEIVFQGLPGGPRLIFITAALVIVFRACYLRTAQRVWQALRHRPAS